MASRRWTQVFGSPRFPSPHRALMVNRAGHIIAVRESEAAWQARRGYVVFARESEILAGESPPNVQSNPRRREDEGDDGA